VSQFQIINRAYIESLTAKRDKETKLGETVQCCENDRWEDCLLQSAAKFILIGIPEDIGVRANLGVGGTASLWQPALKSLLNVQDTEKLNGRELLVLGYFDFKEWMKEAEYENIETLRRRVAAIDDEVFPVIEKIVAADKIPIIIGGGHNNAYPILKGISRAKKAAVNCVNIDAHSDYRAIEGRHSGNGFRYAKMDGYLKHYVMLGLHENYNSRSVMETINLDKELRYYTYEDLFVHENISCKSALDKASHFLRKKCMGVELDLDCITNVLSSAATPCGITHLQARKFITHFATFNSVGYLHITEGATVMADGRQDMMTAKFVAYLVTDFIKAFSKKQTVFLGAED